MRFQDLPDVIDVQTCAQYFRVSDDAVYDAVRRGEIRAIRVFGRVIRIPKGEIARLTGVEEGVRNGSSAI